MKKIDKLFLFLAINAVNFQLTEAAQNYNKLYDKISNNLEKGKSNDSDYKLLEKILNKRNKELKDLYLQNDYVIKPEFLEWQVYFTGFYNNKDRGNNNNKENRLLSYGRGEAKSVDLGMVIPVKGISKDEINLNISPIAEPSVNVSIGNINAPILSAPDFSFDAIELPDVPPLYTPFSDTYNEYKTKSIGNMTSDVTYNITGNSIYNNLNVTSTDRTTLNLDLDNTTMNINGETSYFSSSLTGKTAASSTHINYSDQFAVVNISNNGEFNITGNWDYIITKINRDTEMSTGFLSYRPFFINTDSKVTFNGNLNLQMNNTTDIYNQAQALVGFNLNLSNFFAPPTVKATLENKGIVTVKNGDNSNTQPGIVMQLEVAPSTYTVYGELINSGTINIESTNSGTTGVTGVFVALARSDTGRALVKPGKINVLGNGNKAVEVGSYSRGISNIVASNIIVDGDGGKLYIGGKKMQVYTYQDIMHL